MDKCPTLTVGICAYNEERNIGKLLSSLYWQSLGSARISEILVVSSGSTDKTDSIVRHFAKKDKRVRLITEPERKGKVSAVNLILESAKGEITILCGADLRLDPLTIEHIVVKFRDPKVGICGARPIPTNREDSFCGFHSHLLWGLHHRISLSSPKCGELIALRSIDCKIPAGLNADEAWLEWRIKADGWEAAYAPDAIVHNHGPESVSEIIKQRRRIHAQHMILERVTGYKVSTSDLGAITKGFVAKAIEGPKSMAYCAGAVSIELLSMALGRWDYMQGETHGIWDVASSTKVVNA